MTKRHRKPKPPAARPTALDPVDLESRDRANEQIIKSVAKEAFAPPPGTITNFEGQTLRREHEVLTAVLLEEKRELGRENFWYFFTEILFPAVWRAHYTEEFHGPIAEVLQNLPPGANQLFILPREHRKSYMANLGYALWRVIKNPDIRIMLIGAKEKTVKKWSILMRSAFMPGTRGFEEFQRVYWDFLFKKSGRTPLQAVEWSVENRSAALPDATFFASYLGVTGAGGRANLQIFDDPYERRNVSNPVQSLKALEQTMDLFPLVEVSEGAYLRQRIFLATRWAFHDPTGVFLGERHDGDGLTADDLEELPEFRAMVRHAFEDPKRPCEVCPPAVTRLHPHGHPDVENGEVILAPILTREGLMKRLREYSANPERGEALWYHQYQNICLAPSDQKYQTEWFIRAQFPAFNSPRLRALAIDSADKDFQMEGVGDWMVALFAEFDEEGRLLFVHGLRSRAWTREEFQRKIIAWCRATGWWPQIAVKEKFGGDTFLTDLNRQFNEVERVITCKAVTRPAGSTSGGFMKKLDWIVEGTQAPFERGEIIFGSNFPPELFQRMRYEYCNLGQVKHEDLADCSTLFFVKGIRIESPRGFGHDKAPPTPPSLDLFETGYRAPPWAKPTNPVEQAMRSPRVTDAGLDMKQVNREAKTLEIKLDW